MLIEENQSQNDSDLPKQKARSTAKEIMTDIEDINEMNRLDINENDKKSKKEKYGNGYEAKVIKEKLGDFNLFKSDAYQKITKQFDRSIRFSELLGIINSIEIYLKVKFNICIPKITRNEKRSFPLLIKYVENNSEYIYPYLQYISLCNSSFQKIPLDIE